MKTIQDWLDEYQSSHMNPVNKRLHWICIPPIVFSVIAGLKAVPVGNELVNPATVALLLAWAYYFRLSPRLALGILLLIPPLYGLVLAIPAGALLPVAVGVFVLAWIGQFIGHHVEGARPSFFKDLQFLLIGPLWLLADVYRRLDIPVARSA